jgi:hypothetical protein
MEAPRVMLKSLRPVKSVEAAIKPPRNKPSIGNSERSVIGRPSPTVFPGYVKVISLKWALAKTSRGLEKKFTVAVGLGYS